jgi:DNA-binding NarL/FixJ family response regulator
MPKTTVLLADDHAIMRQGLRALLLREPDIQIVGEAETGRRAIQLAAALTPDVIVMDIAMPLLNGIDATRQILKIVPSTRVVILSSYSDAEYAYQLSDAGAAAYVLKQAAVLELVNAIREAKKGNRFFSPIISRQLMRRYRQTLRTGPPVTKRANPLTPRETEVLQLIAEGKANKEIADLLGLSIKTIENHRQRLMDKLDIHGIAGLTRYAIATGVVESNSLQTCAFT